MRRAGIFLLLLSLTACQSVAYRNDRLYRFIDEMVYGGPLDAYLNRESFLTRWEEPLRVHVIEAETPERRAAILRNLARFEAATGLSARIVDRLAQANITIAFKPDKDFLTNSHYVPCFVRTRREDGRIVNAAILISTADPEYVEPCIAHELMHTFGFDNHSGIVRSALSPAHREPTVSQWDELALSILYHPMVEIGMTRQAAKPLIQRLVSELQRDDYVAKD